MEDWRKKLDQLMAAIVRQDPKLGEELAEARQSPEFQEEAGRIAVSISPAGNKILESFNSSSALETIVLRVGRPVLGIFHNQASLTIMDPESEVWRAKLDAAKGALTTAIQSVGRIDVAHHPFFEWVGTAWLIDENIAVTNRHVAEIFGRSDGTKFVFRQGVDRQPTVASIDLLKEIANEEEFRLKVRRILYIEPEPGPDIAFLELLPSDGAPVPPPIRLAEQGDMRAMDVAVIGYPAKDSRIPDLALMEKIFGDVYDRKRLAPGQLTRVTEDRVFHDCSTLGGCSGAAVIDMATGAAVGLHFAGRFLESNFAVSAPLVGKKLQEVKSGRARHIFNMDAPDKQPGQSYDLTIPLHIRLSIDGTTISIQPQDQQQPLIPTAASPIGDKKIDSIIDDEESDLSREAKPEDYADRTGYDPQFLENGVEAPLPEVSDERQKNDVLTYDNNGHEDDVLRYEHFSVVMCKSRRLCYFSAVNIDGRRTKKVQRVGWKMDPRIPQKAQILNECYGVPPKFSRGHMTRREDPVWGKEVDALRGNADSMCVTNTVPQIQSFNAPVWLALENYALENARKDKMRICVFTGPVFGDNDEERYGVRIPVEFWKVIVFIHDVTEKLSATGYIISQQTYLPEEEFVFGKFGTAQVPIRTIEDKTGLSFGRLSEVDPLKDQLEAPMMPLTDRSQIRF